MKNKVIRLMLLLTILLMTQIVVTAQPEENDPPPPSDAPIDGGVSILIAAGVGYGIKKVRDNRQNKKANHKEF